MNTHGPIQKKYHAQMNALAQTLDELFNGDAKGKDRTVGFALLIFEFGAGDRCNYISNASRPEMISAMKEFIARNEGRYADEPKSKQ